MTRLKSILLTGTMVPALALTPIAGAFAQIPPNVQREIQEKQQHPGGAPHAPGGEMRAPPAGVPHTPEAPRAPVPHAEAPRVEAPHVEAPRVQAPRAEAPRGAGPVEHAAPNRAERMSPPAERAAPPSRAERATPPTERATPPSRAEHMSPPTERATPPSHAEHMTPPAERTAPPARAETPASPTPEHRDGAARPADRAASPAATPPATSRPAGAPAGQRAGQTDGQGRDAERRPPGQPGGNPPPATAAGQPGPNPGGQGQRGFNPQGNQQGDNRRNGGISPGGAAAIGAAAGFAGGFLAATGARDLAGIRNDRRESVEDGRTYIREPGRTIVEDGDRSFIVHDENDRFRELGYDVHRERRGRDFVDTVDRPDGTQILTFTTADGRMLRRVRRTRDGREFVLIDNSYDGGVRNYQDDVVDLPPPRIGIPRERYDVDYADVDEGVMYDTFTAPPLQAPPRRYTLDQIRYSPDVRRYVRSVDINTINFDTGSWIVPGAATGKLQALAGAIKRTIAKNPNSVFLVEGFTDATGNPTDNLSLSDRRAQSVAAILTKDFNVPPENLTTQGYGQQNLKENTQGPSAANRRVVVQNITPLLAAGGQPPR